MEIQLVDWQAARRRPERVESDDAGKIYVQKNENGFHPARPATNQFP
jgi:hypothetical protein